MARNGATQAKDTETVTEKARKYRVWGEANGGLERWRGAVIVPARFTEVMRRRLSEMRKAGEIGPFHFRRLARTGARGAAFWVSRQPKRDRPTCGARTRQGTPCRARAVEGKERCRMHGGLSTGAKTPEGIERIRESNRRRAEARRRDLGKDLGKDLERAASGT